MYDNVTSDLEKVSHEKAKPVKTGDAKLKGLKTAVYGCQLPKPNTPYSRGIPLCGE
jgi:hypothetical protein